MFVADLPDDSFACPARRALPLHDAAHIKMGWHAVDRIKGLDDTERADARLRIIHAASAMSVDIGAAEVELHSAAVVSCEAMSLKFPDDDEHPNKMPFSGVLTRLDVPSDYPVGGTKLKGKKKGHLTFIPKAVGKKALGSLLGMAVDYTKNFDGHDKTAKIGIITGATVEEDDIGPHIRIEGFFYADDFPEETAAIQAEKDRLGFSYEGKGAIQNLDADPWVTLSLCFTGAAVLYKDKAAYTTTSLAAEADKEFEMTEEQMKALLAGALKPMADSITAMGAKVDKIEQTNLEAAAMRDKVKPMADSLRAAAATMEAAGVGTHATNGHVNVLRHMAANMEAEAVMGTVPHAYHAAYVNQKMEAAADDKLALSIKTAVEAAVKPLQTSLEAANTELKDLKAKGFKGAEQPGRKTLSPEVVSLLEKHKLSASAEAGTLTIAQVDDVLKGLPAQERTTQKLKLMASGVLQTPATA